MRYRAQIPTHGFAFVGADKATAGPGVVEAIATADVVFLAPSNPVVSVGAILAVPGIRGALRSTAAPVIGYSPIVGGKPLRGMADECLSVIGVASTSEAVGGHFGARSGTGILDGWLIDEGDHAEIDGVDVRSIPLLMTDPKATAEMVRAGLELAGVDSQSTEQRIALGPMSATTAPPPPSRSCPCPGFPSSGPATTWPRRSPAPHRGCATTTSSWSPARCCPRARAASSPHRRIPRSGMPCGAG